MADLPKVCIIGAGSSGIATIKALRERNLDVECFEASDRIGGNWVFRNKNGMSSAYRSLHINTSRDKMSYSDFPMPDDYPDFPHHSQIARYFDAYADHFGLRDAISFNTSVTWARRDETGLWHITLSNGEQRVYDALIVANGHHWDPRWPEPSFPGNFSGETLHAHHYLDPAEPVDCLGKNVVIVGFGNSALDIACELGRKGVAENVYLSMRRGYWVMPKYFGGKVLDALNVHPSKDPPLWQRLLGVRGLRLALKHKIKNIHGAPEDHGLPEPDHQLFETHPAISQEIYIRIGSGDVLPRPNIERLDGDGIIFTDGSRVEADVLIYCTGYKITFPFFDQEFLSAPDNDIALWKRMIDPRYPNLLFVGLFQPLCAIMPVAEVQAKFIAEYLTGTYCPPPADIQDRERQQEYNRERSGWMSTPRHTIQINCGQYTYDLRRELRKGQARAAKAGHPLAVPVRAEAQETITEAAE